MPYTLSHPAAVVVLGRVRLNRATGEAALPLAALVAGSLALDLPYYMPFPKSAPPTHSLLGLVTVDIVLGLALYAAWISVILRPFLWLAPRGVQRRVPPLRRTGLATRLPAPAAWLGVLLAVFIGATTHLVWDSFTHSGRWGTENWPRLQQHVSGYAVYSWLQLASSIAGLALMGWVVVRWWRRTPAQWPCEGGSRWLTALVWAVLVGYPAWAALGRLRHQWSNGRDPATGQVYLGDLMVTTAWRFTDALAVAVVLFVLAWHLLAISRWLWADPLAYREPASDHPATPPAPPPNRRSSADSPHTGHG